MTKRLLGVEAHQGHLEHEYVVKVDCLMDGEIKHGTFWTHDMAIFASQCLPVDILEVDGDCALVRLPAQTIEFGDTVIVKQNMLLATMHPAGRKDLDDWRQALFDKLDDDGFLD